MEEWPITDLQSPKERRIYLPYWSYCISPGKFRFIYIECWIWGIMLPWSPLLMPFPALLGIHGFFCASILARSAFFTLDSLFHLSTHPRWFTSVRLPMAAEENLLHCSGFDDSKLCVCSLLWWAFNINERFCEDIHCVCIPDLVCQRSTVLTWMISGDLYHTSHPWWLLSNFEICSFDTVTWVFFKAF